VFKKNFLSGLLVVLPLILSLWLMNWVFSLLTAYIPVLIHQIAPNSTLSQLIENDLFNLFIRAIGLIFFVVIVTFVGVFARNFFGSKAVKTWDLLIERIPILNVLHSGIRQMLGTVIGDGSKMFSKVVLLEYPREGCWSIAFFTSEVDERISKHIGEQSLVSVFVPTTPNPTSGFLVMVPEHKVIELDISVSTGMQMVISGGAININELEKKEKIG
jgi:uncharacterized membrane protein